MAKVIDVPHSGKLGLVVYMPGRNGLVKRTWTVPANPKTAAQSLVRSQLGQVAALWRSITEAQQDAWIALAATLQSNPVLGQSGPLTGSQLFTKINCSRLVVGEATVADPPALPSFPTLPVTGLTITNTAGAIALKLACADDLETNTMLRMTRPQSGGTRRAITWNYLGTCPVVSGGYSTVTSLYTAEFGVPAVGTRIFAQVNQNVDGWQDNRVMFSAVVPVSA